MKKASLSVVAILFTINLLSQKFEVPKNYSLVVAEDYAPYEQDVINCVDWLMSTPLDKHIVKRQNANAFLLKWLTGSPYVHIDIRQEVVTFVETSPDLLMMFLGGWAKYSLESRDYDNKVAGSVAGIEAVIEFYKKNKGALPKDKNVEKYIKMQDKGKLKAYIQKYA